MVENAVKPTEFEYLMKLIPNVSIFDEVERFAILNNKSGVFSFSGENPKLFFYSDNDNRISTNTGFKRAIFKIYGQTIESSGINNNHIFFEKPESNTDEKYIQKHSILLIVDENLSKILNDADTAGMPYYYIISLCEKDVTIKVDYPESDSYGNILDFNSTIIGVSF